MEADKAFSQAALMQAKTLHRVLATNAELLAGRPDVREKEALLDPQLLLDLARTLEDLVNDSVQLLGAGVRHKYTAADSKFLQSLARHVQLALDDQDRLRQQNGDGDSETKYSTLAVGFINELTRTISAVHGDNVFAQGLLHGAAGLSLQTSSPEFLRRLLAALGRAAEMYVQQAKDTALLAARANSLEEQVRSNQAISDLYRAKTAQYESYATRYEMLERDQDKTRSSLQDAEESVKRLQDVVAEKDAKIHRLTAARCGEGIAPPSSEGTRASSALRERKRRNCQLDLAAWGSPPPPTRAQELACLREVTAEPPEGQEEFTAFSHETFRGVFGGTRVSVFARCASGGIASRHNSEHLCVQLNHHPWGPTGPGQHGFVFAGLGNDKDHFKHGDQRHIIVGPFKEFLYCGLYRLNVVEPLTAAEWHMLPPSVKETQVDRSRGEEWAKDKSVAQILAQYDLGERRLPCVRLECIEFDAAFYEDILDELYPPASPPAVAPATLPKRRRSSSESSDGDSDELPVTPYRKHKRT